MEQSIDEVISQRPSGLKVYKKNSQFNGTTNKPVPTGHPAKIRLLPKTQVKWYGHKPKLTVTVLEVKKEQNQKLFKNRLKHKTQDISHC